LISFKPLFLKQKTHMAKKIIETIKVAKEQTETTEVVIIKEHPMCGNPLGDVCKLPIEFAEMLIKEGFAEAK